MSGWGRLEAHNYRGLRVPRLLGIALAACAAASALVVASVTHVAASGWGALAGALLVCAAGLADDLAPVGPRGLRNHVRSLLQGHMTTGILKLLVAAGSSLVVVALQPRRGWAIELAGALLISSCTNLWNGLDVAPGRGLKAFLVVASLLAASWPAVRDVPILPGVVAGAVAALPLDLRERAMLGDGGATLLGFVAGLALYAALPDAGVVVAAAASVFLNVVADTVSLSRVIERTPPLRWFDRLGRVSASD